MALNLGINYVLKLSKASIFLQNSINDFLIKISDACMGLGPSPVQQASPHG